MMTMTVIDLVLAVMIALAFVALAHLRDVSILRRALAEARRDLPALPRPPELDPYRGVSATGPEPACPGCLQTPCIVVRDRLRSRLAYQPPECWPDWYALEVAKRQDCREHEATHG